MSKFQLFDRSRIELRPLSDRGSQLSATDCWPLEPPAEPYEDPDFPQLVERILAARRRRRPVILMMGGHPIKLGLSRFLIDLVQRHLVTHVALNGGALIHDFELALAGETSEDVARWIQVGQFGLWHETSRLNDIVRQAAKREEGFGEAVGRVIEDEQFPWRDLSVSAACSRAGTPLTCHVSIGSDIIHSMANCDGASLGQATYTDFLIFARSVQDLEGGVYLNVGTAVTGPEVFLKALAMTRNVARQAHQSVSDFTTAVFDLTAPAHDYRAAVPGPDDPRYYYRPWKTLLVRTVASGGDSFAFAADHRKTLPTLWHKLVP